MNTPMDATDRELLNRIQSDFPICSQPYQRIAETLGIDQDEVLERVKRLKAEGVIRRIGGNLVPEKMGYVSTLCAARVPAEQVNDFARVVNRFPGVTHNYLREHAYNVWFTFISPSIDEIRDNLQRISVETGGIAILNLPATRVFKIRAHFAL